MDFSPSPRVVSITEVVREFLAKEVHPLEQGFLQNGFVSVLRNWRNGGFERGRPASGPPSYPRSSAAPGCR